MAAMEGRGEELKPWEVPSNDLSASLARETKLQQQLEHARKMESTGARAGGIAHDFTNLLHTVQSYATLTRTDASQLNQVLLNPCVDARDAMANWELLD
jgi:signal transduction histidine kinase